MPCALPPVDQAASQLGWGHGVFYPSTVPGRPRTAPVFHSGIDFMADVGAPVVVPYAGVVAAIGNQPYGGTLLRGVDALGHYVVINHGSVVVGQPSVVTRYAHLRAPSTLRVGDRVATGDLIGFVGTSGRAPENQDRSLTFFQALRNWREERPDGGVPTDAMRDFFVPLGVRHEGAQDPGPRTSGFEQTPVWGGQLVQDTSCGSLSTSIDPRRQQPVYSRYGRTQLSSRAPYPPARYAASSSESSGGMLFAGIGLAFGAWLLFRPRAAKPPPWWVRQRRWRG